METDLAERTRSRIRQVMADKQISQQRLAQTLGRPQGTVGKWLRGDLRLTVEHMGDIADAIGVSAAELVRDDTYIQPTLEAD